MNNVFYITYNIQLKNFLMGKGIRYGVCGVNPTNNKTFWVYDRTKQNFIIAIDEWMINKKNINVN